MFSSSVAQLLRCYLLLSCGVVSKKNIHNYMERLLKYSSPTTYLCEVKFSLYTSTKKVITTDKRIQLSFVNLDMKEIYKNVT